MGPRNTVLAGLLALASLAGCASDERSSYATSYYAGEEAGRSTPAARGAGAEGGERVTIPAVVKAQLDGFLGRGTTLLGDRVEADLSQVYFLASASFTVSKDVVEHVESVDRARGLRTVTLRVRPGTDYQTVYETMPKVYFGEGKLQLVAVEELVLRFWTGQGAERPIWLSAVAQGAAALLEDGPPPRRVKGEAIRLDAEIRRGPDGAYRFAQGVEGGQEVPP